MQARTDKQKRENNKKLVDGLSEDVLHHSAGDERLGPSVRFALQQVGRGHLSGQRQGRQRVHN